MEIINEIATARQMQEIDRKTVEGRHKTEPELMENAGKSVAEISIRKFNLKKGKKVLIIAGPGNNGGDGFVSARYLKKCGCRVFISIAGDKSKYKGSSKTNLKKIEDEKCKLVEFSDIDLSGFDLVVDALFGTGLKKGLESVYKDIVEVVNGSNITVVSIDIPSGLIADKNDVPGPAIRADLTVTFGMPKLCHFLYPAREHVGKLEIVNIGFPESLLKAGDKIYYIDKKLAGKYLPRRWRVSHKNNYGHLLIFGGSPGKTGAAFMASSAALESGSGLVTILCDERINSILEIKTTEVMTEPVDFSGFPLPELSSFDCLVAGPGLGMSEEAITNFKKLIEKFKGYTVIDADGLNILSQDKDLLKKISKKSVLTPHYGEFSRITGIPVEKLKSNKIKYANEFSVSEKTFLILKGEDTIIAAPDGCLYINTTGNPGMAKAGCGDVLSGLIGGILVQNIKRLNIDNITSRSQEQETITGSLLLAVWLHGLCGDLVNNRKNIRSIKATDMINDISSALNLLEK